MVLGAVFDLVELRLDRGLLTLVLAHLADDGIFLESLHTMYSQRSCPMTIGRAEMGAEANLNVVFPRHVSVGM